MGSEKREVSSWVFVGFVLLFMVFILLNPNKESNTNAIIGSTTLGENPSIITLIILFIILVVVLAAVFVIFKKIKKKKIKIGSPEPHEEKKEEVNLSQEKKESKGELNEDVIERLFSENNIKHVEEKHEEVDEYKPIGKLQQSEKKELINLQDLKNKIKGMLTQKFTKEQIISSLKSQGVSINQINKSIEEVNLDNLRDYITQALKQGFSKDQIIRNLAMHGWKQEQISKVI